MSIRSVLSGQFTFLSETQISQFETYFEMLVEQNKVMNLTGITEEDEVAVKHFTDSLTCLDIIKNNNVKTLADIGTGAGFPGIPLKIAMPELKVTLIDSLDKRVGFLNSVISALKLENIEAVHGRAEDEGRNPEFRESFDMAVARAVAPMNILTEYCLPFVRNGGLFLAMKGPGEEPDYSNALKELHGNIVSDELFELKGANPEDEIMQRRLILVKKCGNISSKYPRKAGIPKKKPL